MPRHSWCIVALIALIALALAGCGGGGGGGGGGTPGTVTVSFTSPAEGERTVNQGAVVVLTVNATASGGVARVEFFLNGQSMGSDASAPYSMPWNTAGVAAGNYQIRATAYDRSNPPLSASVTINVTVQISPVTVSFTSPPADRRQVARGEVVSLGATASAPSGINRVEFSVNATGIGTVNAAPYNTNWDTAAYAAGTYTVTAQAFDNASPQNTAQTSIQIEVLDPAQAPPTVQIVSPQNGATVSGTVRVTISAEAKATGATVSSVEITFGTLPQQTLVGSGATLDGHKDFNTLTLTDGSYNITAVVRDSNNRTSSNSVNVSVQNTSAPPPPPW